MAAERKQMRVYLTLEDVLDTGIVETEGFVTGDDVNASSLQIKLFGDAHMSGGFFFPRGAEGILWHRHKGSANRRAREIRRQYIVKLEAETRVKIDRVNALDFGVSTGGFRG